MPPIRNSCVARGGFSSATQTVLYTVPTNYVFLLKSVVLFNQGGSTSAVNLQLNAPGIVELPFYSASIASGVGAGFSGWIAMNGGDQIYGQSQANVLIEYWISGALLPFVPGF